MKADMNALRQAKSQLENTHLGKGGVHTLMLGEIKKNGQPTGEVGVVALVDEKLAVAQLNSPPLPREVVTPAGPVKVDVQVAPQPTDMRLTLPSLPYVDGVTGHYYSPQGIDEWRQCHLRPIPGGVQIAPENAGWVGTLSCACYGTVDGERQVGALTNYHVAMSQLRRGIKVGQPSGSSGDYFGIVQTWSEIVFSTSANNRVDGAFMTTWRSDGKYAPGCHTVKPVQYKIGNINPSPVLQHNIGDKVQKSGRTTGHQTGRVVGIESTSHISYSQGTAKFVGQTVIRGDAGDFSGPGDSGSLVLTPDNRPYGLLFAGGGGTTIINPISDVMEVLGISFFGME